MERINIKFLLISPAESFYLGDFNINYGVAPPLGLLYLGSILENDGDKVDVLDFSAEMYDEQKLKSCLKSADIIGISLISTSTKRVNYIIKLIKEYDPDIPIIIGGPHCNLFPDRALKETGANICLQGDGEKVILEIKNALCNNKSLSNIPGVYYIKNGNLKKGPCFQLISNLNDIPFPARHLVKKYNYGLAYNPDFKSGDFTTILTGRGCPFNCRFCSRSAACMSIYRKRSTENILNEIKKIRDENYKYVAFMDDSFLSNKKQANEIFDTINNENINMKFYVLAARVDSADSELYKKMKKAGVISLKFGLESGNQEVLDFYNKKISIDKIRYAVNLSHKTGFFTAGTFIFGAPFETKKHFINTIKFAKSLPLESATFLSLRYMAGADLWSEAVKNGKILSDEYLVLADSKRRLGIFSQKEIKKFCKKAHWIFFYNPRYIVRLLKSCLEKNDFSNLKIFLSVYFSYIKKHINIFNLQYNKQLENQDI